MLNRDVITSRLVIILCEHGRAEDTTRTVVASIMQDLARSLGYASCATFLKERHLVNLVAYWLSICDTDDDFGKEEIEESAFGSFPFHLFQSDNSSHTHRNSNGGGGGGNGSLAPDLSAMVLVSARIKEQLSEFVCEHVDTVLPLLVSELVRRKEEDGGRDVHFHWLDSLASIIGGENVAELFYKHAGRVLGWTLPVSETQNIPLLATSFRTPLSRVNSAFWNEVSGHTPFSLPVLRRQSLVADYPMLTWFATPMLTGRLCTQQLAVGKPAYIAFLAKYYSRLSEFSQTQLGEIFVELVTPMVVQDGDDEDGEDADADGGAGAGAGDGSNKDRYKVMLRTGPPTYMCARGHS